MKELPSRRLFLKYAGAYGINEGIDRTLGLSRREVTANFQTEAFRDYIYQLIDNPADIGGKERYHDPLEAGMGFATWHRQTHGTALRRSKDLKDRMDRLGLSYTDLTSGEQNLYRLTVNGRQSVLDRLSQRKLSPLEALKSDVYAGYLSTCSPEDLYRKYLAWAAEKEGQYRQVRFLGAVLVVDCPRQRDWDNKLAHSEYMKTGQQWIADVSDELMRRLPLGANPNRNDLNKGRPGLVLVSEDQFYKYIFPSRTSRIPR